MQFKFLILSYLCVIFKKPQNISNKSIVSKVQSMIDATFNYYLIPYI